MYDTAPKQTNEVDWWDVNNETLRFNQLIISPCTRVVLKDGTEMHLTTVEFDLPLFLASHPGQIFTREGLTHKVWDYIAPVDCSNVTMHIRRLREKGRGFS
ncbi:MAG: winged helix-turn-helix domain-containing protein [Dehalococcoidia bacterium]|jgi:DNA-binding response OmpR family regulator|nr:winged helix-turn-helix domain-containing protein [Dehalococcoidia bacterium]